MLQKWNKNKVISFMANRVQKKTLPLSYITGLGIDKI